MKDVSENELLSAYLDGELTTVERAEVERLLASSRTARRLLEELKALRNALHEMPRKKLDEDLSEHILQAAERRILTGSVDPGQASPLWRTTARRFLNLRGVVWSALAVAVAVIVMVNAEDPERPDVRKVVRSDARPGDQSRSLDEGLPSDLSRSRQMKGAPSNEDSLALEADTTTTQKGRGVDGSVIRAKAAADPGMAAMSNPSVVSKGRGPSDSAERSREPNEPMLGKKMAGSSVSKEAGKKAATGRIAKGSLAMSQDVLIVECEVSPEAARRQLFDAVLIKNNIAWRETSEEVVRHETLDKDLRRKRAAVSNLAYQNAEPNATDAVYVEATPQQIEGMLAVLNSSPDKFLSVAVEPARNTPSQQAWLRFNRSNVATGVLLGKADRQESARIAVDQKSAESTAVPAGVAQRLPMVNSAPVADMQGPFDENWQQEDRSIAQKQTVIHALQQLSQLQKASHQQNFEVKRAEVGTDKTDQVAQQIKPSVDKMSQALFVLRVLPVSPTAVAEEQENDPKSLPGTSNRAGAAKSAK